LRYSDDVLLDLSATFTLSHWTLLEILAGYIDENGEPVEQPQATATILTLKELQDFVQISPMNYRQSVAYLEGAKAVTIMPGMRDQRYKDVKITDNGLRMLELRKQEVH